MTFLLLALAALQFIVFAMTESFFFDLRTELRLLNEKLNQVEYMFRRKRKNGG